MQICSALYGCHKIKISTMSTECRKNLQGKIEYIVAKTSCKDLANTGKTFGLDIEKNRL